MTPQTPPPALPDTQALVHAPASALGKAVAPTEDAAHPSLGDGAAAAIDAQCAQCVATPGHFDELRGAATPIAPYSAAPEELCAAWSGFFAHAHIASTSDLDHRFASLQRQIRDNGVTYNVYADQEGPQRPWSLDLFPLLVEATDWAHIEAGVLQRMQLLEAVMADVYGPQNLLHQGLLPPALVYGHPGYLRAMHGVQPAGGVRLHIAAFDLARGPSGQWQLIGQRCQAPSGLGYLLENRLAVAAQFPQAFQALRVQRLAASYRALVASLQRASPAGAASHIALLTPGPYNETYFEHAYLARYLGLSLVEGSDLVVRQELLYLKTLDGLVPVHGLLKRVDDPYLDPLELRADSTLGVPGLLQAVRAGNVMLANAPGSAFLESPALLGFMPALARQVLGQDLTLPAAATWWCGEASAKEAILPHWHTYTVKPTYPGSPLHASFETLMGHTLAPPAREALSDRMAAQGDAYTVQAYVALSQLPVWSPTTADAPTQGSGGMQAKSAMLRVFALSDGVDERGAPRWQILPGGLVRLAASGKDIASMQHGGSSADAWVRTPGPVDTSAHMGTQHPAVELGPRKRLVTSRAAENLYWLGRYTERTDNTIRLSKLALECLGGEDQTSLALQQWLTRMARANTLVLPDAPAAQDNRLAFERALIASLGAADGATSTGFNLRALRMAAAAVRERLSQEHWKLIERTHADFFNRCSAPSILPPTEAMRILQTASEGLAAITGAQTDRMTRDDGWRLLSIGRHLERLAFLSQALAFGLQTQMLQREGGFEAMLALFDSTITFRAQYQQSRSSAALFNLLVLDRDNPRSLAWVAYTLRARLAKLANSPSASNNAIAAQVPDPETWNFSSAPDYGADATALVQPVTLEQLLDTLRQATFEVSDAIGTRYFTHSGQATASWGR